MENKTIFPVTKTMTSQILPTVWETASLDSTKQNLPALIKGLFVDPYGKPGRALEGLLGKVAEVLRTQGVGKENLQAALIIFSVICSAQVGIPLAIVLRANEEKAVADDLVTTCLKMVPESLFVELKNLTIDDLYSVKDHFKNKVLVCRDFKSLKKVESDLKNLIINGKTSIQTSTKTKFGTQMIEFQVNGPVSFIGIETESETPMFDHPAIIRLAISDSNFCQGGYVGEERKIPAVGFEMARMAQYVSRLSYCNVSFLQQDEFLKSVRNQRPTSHINKCRFAIRLMEVLAILNNPAPQDFNNFIAKMLNRKSEDVNAWLKEIGFQKNLPKQEDGDLIIGKAEYFIMVKLLDGLLPIKQTVPSLLRRQLFKAVKAINMTLLVKAFIPTNNILQQLYTLAHNDTYWAKLEDIYLNFNSNRVDIVSEAIIEKELAALKKIGIIERRKLKNNDGYGYFVTDISVDKGIEFPIIHELFGECEEGQLIEIVNPLTGIVELI